jgi:BASS family bile acid:Na+ symporter
MYPPAKNFAAVLKVAQSYPFVLAVAMTAGLFLPWAQAIVPHTTKLLVAIFFLSAVKIDMPEVVACFRNKRVLLAVNAWMLVVRPALVYWAVRPFSPDLALGLMILSAMPAGMTSPLLTELVAGGRGLALVLTVSSSLLAPFTVPIMIKLLAGTSVAVSFSSMFLSLSKVIFIPFAVAQIVRLAAPKVVAKVAPRTKPVSVVLLGLLISGIVASKAEAIRGGFSGPFGTSIAALVVLFLIYHAVGYALAFWRGRRDRVTVTVCATYLNFSLAIYLAGQFFPEPRILMPAVLSVLPWSLMMPLFQWVVRRWHLAEDVPAQSK